jgi:hypothetical protein
MFLTHHITLENIALMNRASGFLYDADQYRVDPYRIYPSTVHMSPKHSLG